MGAAQVHVQGGLFRAPAEEAWLWENGDAREPLLPGLEPVLHLCVAVPGPQRLMVGGRGCEIPVLDVGRGVGPAQGRVPSIGQRSTKFRLLSHRAKRPHGGGLQLEVAVIAGDNELGVAGARRPVLQDGVLG